MGDGRTFEGKRVAITGAAGNLGRAVASAFLAAGARVLLLDRVASRLSVEGEAAARVESHVVDLTDTRASAEAFAGLGALDALCNIAGGFDMGTPVHETTPEQWERMLDINVRTLLNSVRGAVPGMLARGHGTIVNVGAKAALASPANMAPYTGSKSVVIRITESLAAELKEAGINVNCVLPSALDTPENRAAMPNADPARWVEPAALADVVMFLASPAARAVHGAAIPVTGLS